MLTVGRFIDRRYYEFSLSMLIYAFCVIPVVFAKWAGTYSMWYAVLIIALATSAHQAWSANIFTTVSDMFPKKAVATVPVLAGWQVLLAA